MVMRAAYHRAPFVHKLCKVGIKGVRIAHRPEKLSRYVKGCLKLNNTYGKHVFVRTRHPCFVILYKLKYFFEAAICNIH